MTFKQIKDKYEGKFVKAESQFYFIVSIDFIGNDDMGYYEAKYFDDDLSEFTYHTSYIHVLEHTFSDCEIIA